MFSTLCLVAAPGSHAGSQCKSAGRESAIQIDCCRVRCGEHIAKPSKRQTHQGSRRWSQRSKQVLTQMRSFCPWNLFQIPTPRRSAKSSFECLPAVDDEFSPTSIADGSEVPVPVAPSHVEIRDPAKVSWLDRFSLEEVRIESGHTYFDPSLQDAKTSLPLEGVPGPSTTGNSPVFGPLPTDATTVTRPPQIANPPYRPYRFPQSPQQYREQSMAATTCTVVVAPFTLRLVGLE